MCQNNFQERYGKQCLNCKAAHCSSCVPKADRSTGQHFNWRLEEAPEWQELDRFHVLIGTAKHRPPFKKGFVCGRCYVESMDAWIAEREPSSESSDDDSEYFSDDEEEGSDDYTDEEEGSDSIYSDEEDGYSDDDEDSKASRSSSSSSTSSD